MTGTFLEQSLHNVIMRLQRLRILRWQTVCWLLLVVPGIAVTLWLPASVGHLRLDLPVLLGTSLLGLVLSRLLTKKPSVNDAARLIEQTHPELNDAVITAVQVSQRPGRRPSVLSALAIQEADQLARQRDWSRAVSGRNLAKWTLFSFLSFVVMVSSLMAASRYGRDLVRPSSSFRTAAQKSQTSLSTKLEIEPGDAEIERGSALTVVARFPDFVPTNAVLEFVDSQQFSRRISMTETVDAGVFATRMEGISSDGEYRVLYSQDHDFPDQPHVSPGFKVTTYVRPKLEQVDALVTPPAWSGQLPETIEDIMRITVTDGSNVVLKLKLNKPVLRAELQPKTGLTIVLTPTDEDPSVVETRITAIEDNFWTVHLEDSDGRTSADDEQIAMRVRLNSPPKLQATFPGRDTTVSPLQEFLVEAIASDDFGIVGFGLQYSLSGRDQKDVELKPSESTTKSDSDSAANAAIPEPHAAIFNVTISHQINLELLNATPDDLVTYSFWASDIAADGSERRSYSDIMFAEVRRFEDIFRESEQSGGQQQQQKSTADDLLKLQKEIISATWNTIRAEPQKRKDATFTEEVGIIAESQGQAIQLLTTAMEDLSRDPKTTALAEQALEEMKAAKQKLEEAQDASGSSALTEAMHLENKVTYTLLRMRASEFQVQQQNQRSGSSGGSSASQQQMQQLELDNKRNRYETEKQAEQQQEQSQRQREQVQILNRLKELARRQQMVNERLKQLESELRAATSDKEREEVERELKRLRDEQREMLRDVDEVNERMEQSADRQKPESAQMQQQMEQAREKMQQASRAMEEGELAQAISEGTRAERQFEELTEEFRNQTSSQFDDSMRNLRDQARQLSERQAELARQLAGEVPDERPQGSENPGAEKSNGRDSSGAQERKAPSLRAGRDRQQLQKDASEQQNRLDQVVEQAKQIIEQAEQTEPLLSNKLYETLRDVKDSKPDEALQATELLAGRGLWSQSQQAEQVARKGIEELKTGIEVAAESVLGSEAESLRRAQTQLKDATEKLANELRDATGDDGQSGNTEAGKHESPNQLAERKDKMPGAEQNPGEIKPPGENQPSNESSDQPNKAAGSTTEGEPVSKQEGLKSGPQPGAGGNRSNFLLEGGREHNSPRGGSNGSHPLTGNEFTEWSDQLRDVEEMLNDPELRNRMAQVRDRARSMRAEFKRHGEEPQWDLVESQLLDEMRLLQQRITQELAKRGSERAMVPIDREPVPEEFDSLVRKYYELLGQERESE